MPEQRDPPQNESLEALRRRCAELEAEMARQRQTIEQLRREQTAAGPRPQGRWASLVGMAPDLCFLLDRNANILYLNRTTSDLKVEDVVGTSAYDYVPPAEQARVRATIEAALDRGETAEYETHYEQTDGARLWFEVRVGPIRTGGEITGAVLIARDVTSRRKAEEEAARQRHFFEMLADASPAIVFRIDTVDKLVFVNRRWTEITGLPAPNWLDHSWTKALHPDDVQRVTASWQQAVANGDDWRCEFRLQSASGNPVWIAAQASAVQDHEGCVTSYVGTGTDISALKQANQRLEKIQSDLEQRVKQRTAALAASEEAFRSQTRILKSILDNLANGVVVADRQGKFLLFNPAAEQIIGLGAMECPPEEWPERYGLFLADGETLCPPHRLALCRAIRGEHVRNEVGLIRNANTPAPVWVSVSATPLVDPQGKLQGGVTIFRDISERRAIDNKLRQERQLLRKLLDLQERDRKLISHDIHDGLIQYVVGAKMMIEAASVARGPEAAADPGPLLKARDMLGKAIAEGRRMISELRPMVIDEHGIVDAIKFLIADETSQPVVDVQFTYPPELQRLDPMVEGAMFRIVQEALNNVRRHSRCQAATVELELAGDMIRLVVADDGVGFCPEKVPDSRFGVRGIRERARLFGGRAVIDSAPHEGTRVIVELPVDGAKAPPDADA